MHRRAARPRSHPIALQFQLLWHRVTIDNSSAAIADELRYLVQHADQAIAPTMSMRYEVRERATATGFVVFEQGDELSVESDAVSVLDTLYRRIHQRAFEFASLQGWVRMHGAVVDVDGHRVLLVGASGVGKSTLVLRLLFDGAAVHGDESALVHDGHVLAVPRPLHLKPGVDDLVPEMAPFMASLPCLDADPPVRAFDPTTAGLAWRIDETRLDDLVLVERAHGGWSSLEPAGAAASMPEIVEQVFPNQESRAAVIREVAAVLRTAKCWRLRLGDVAEAAGLLESIGAAS